MIRKQKHSNISTILSITKRRSTDTKENVLESKDLLKIVEFRAETSVDKEPAWLKSLYIHSSPLKRYPTPDTVRMKRG